MFAGCDELQQHPPERGMRSRNHVVLYAGCSCCCCCLHTVGGMIGVAVVGNYRSQPDESANSEIPTKPLVSSQKLFWSSFLWVTLVSFLFGGLLNVSTYGSEGFFLAGFWMLLFGPAFLLVACAVSAFQISVRIDLKLQRGYWRHLGKITLGMLAGSGLGLLLTMGLFGMF